jgi:hypothetical protein
LVQWRKKNCTQKILVIRIYDPGSAEVDEALISSSLVQTMGISYPIEPQLNIGWSLKFTWQTDQGFGE